MNASQAHKSADSTINKVIAFGINLPKMAQDGAEIIAGRFGRFVVAASEVLGLGSLTFLAGKTGVERLPEVANNIGAAFGDSLWDGIGTTVTEVGEKVLPPAVGVIIGAGMTVKAASDFPKFATSVSRNPVSYVEISES